MFTRIVVVASLAMVLAACDDNPKKSEEKEKSPCAGLSETECTAKSECVWDAPDSECEDRPTQ